MALYYVIFPTETEAGPFLEVLDVLEPASVARRTSHSGRLGGWEFFVVVCGVGQANAAQTVAALCESARPGLIVLAGCAGAYRGSGLSVGDVAVASSETYADTGVDTPSGFIGLEEAGLSLLDMEGVRMYGSINIPAGAALDPERLAGGGFAVKQGGFLTVSTVSGTLSRGGTLFKRHGALCENMEGAAAAQVAALYGVPFLEIRGISNMVEDRDRDAWDIALASRNCAAALKAALEVWTA